MKCVPTVYAAAFAFSLLCGTACKGELQEQAPESKVAKKSRAIRVVNAVPYGKHIRCADAFPDKKLFSVKMAVEVGEIRDLGETKKQPTMACALIRAGEPPKKSNRELKTLAEKYATLGVLPGDTFCQISAHCSSAHTPESFRDKCETSGQQSVTLDGQYACLRSTRKGAQFSYTYRFIEPDTKCIIEALAGPSVNEQELVKQCALAAREAMTMNSVAQPY